MKIDNIHSVNPRLLPRVRIARRVCNCGGGDMRAVPVYIEVIWWQWRFFAWLGEKV